MQTYREGSIVMVPLRTTGFAPGVIARRGESPILFGYFFHQRLPDPSMPTEPLAPASASRLMRFADLGLVNGSWHVVGQVAEWNRDDWPMPDFQQVGRDASVGLRLRFSEDDPIHELSREAATMDALAGLPYGGSYGSGAVEIVLTTDHDPKYREEYLSSSRR